jgi:hypothetical protein
MPKVGKKEFPYTKAGYKAAEAYKKSMKKTGMKSMPAKRKTK